MSVVSSASEAPAAIDEFRPPVLVSDIAMLLEDGYSLIGRVRSMQGSRRIPAVALTAYASTDDRRRAIASRFDVHLAKPVDPIELVRILEAIAGGAASGP